ncbi:MAG: hypothetical protein OHK0012_02500 [Synechococcales cyanobacterium]
MTSELLLRSQVLGTQVINQADAARIGIISQVWVDPQAQQVLVLSSREQAFSGGTQTLLLERVAAVGRDAILVASEEALEDLDLSDLERVVGCEVISEDGVRLGKVKDFEFDRATGEITSLILSSLGIPLLPGFLLSTYQLQAADIKAMGRDRVMVVEGAETRLVQLSRSVFEQFGLGKAPWMQDALPPALPSAASGDDRDEEYDERYEEEYEDETEEEEEETAIYAPEATSEEMVEEEEPYVEEEEEEAAPINPPMADYAAEYANVPVEDEDEEQ